MSASEWTVAPFPPWRAPDGNGKQGRERNMKNRSMNRSRAISLATLLAGAPFFAGCASIHKAADNGDVAGIEQFLQRGADVDARDRYGRTPLMFTLSNPDIVRHLVEKGADVNARDLNGETPLMKAAFLGQLDVVRYLVEKGAEVNARSQRGKTVVMFAIRDLDVVQYLVEKGADVNAVDANGETLLLQAAVLGRLSVVQYLMQQGATVEAGAEGGGTR
jgi:ankyrin repeat protein